MATSIGKLSKSFFVKLLVGIIILPFVFWGMGDVFRGGNQNVIATIDSKKVSTQEFVNYLNRLDLNKEQIKSLKKTNLMDKILSEYIGRKVMALEIEQSGITVNDNSLRDIIKNDRLFFKDGKFSRTEYEKFLIMSLKELSFTVIPDCSISKAITFRPMYSDKILSIKLLFFRLFVCSLSKFNRCK